MTFHLHSSNFVSMIWGKTNKYFVDYMHTDVSYVSELINTTKKFLS